MTGTAKWNQKYPKLQCGVCVNTPTNFCTCPKNTLRYSPSTSEYILDLIDGRQIRRQRGLVVRCEADAFSLSSGTQDYIDLNIEELQLILKEI